MSVSYIETGCKYNPRGIVCDKNRPCEKCGWEPEEWKYRVAEIRLRRMGVISERENPEK